MARTGAMCVGLAVALVGCGGGEEKDPDEGTNGVGRLPAAKIETKARKAALGARAVHLSGTVVSQGRSYRLDMRLKEDGGTGQVSTKDATFELLRVGEDLYLKADADFWTHEEGAQGGGGTGNGTGTGDTGGDSAGTGSPGGPDADDRAAARKLEDKYVKVPVGDPSYQQLGGFTDKKVLLDGLLGLHGTLTTGDRGEVAGVRTIRVLAGKGSGGSVDVSLEGAPYPLRLQRAGDAGVIRLADWNRDFELTAPEKKDVVDYGQQLPAHD
ncbi:hypothetical protein IHE55_19590 [Streptomyces pactum]|uniref:Lipoprotein n=1 Tax=Streptomyces pactum TaxID=68249 RepID=A0ABS0NNS0_9ACTN|nr:hypothetical protein [Streptomyces pactum]MBH5336851.1 hypothetical protein [Streptomyces pactum]